MTTQTVRWLPASAPNIVAYKLLYSDTGPEGPFLERVAAILNVPAGPNWDIGAGAFFYEDREVPYRLYRLNTIDSFGTIFGDPGAAPFGPNNDPVRVPVPNVYPLDHNTGGANALKYVDPNGLPIAEATVRVYTKADWDAKRYSKVVGLVKTDADGRWLSPVFVEPGNTFVVQFQLPNTWGPDTTEVVV